MPRVPSTREVVAGAPVNIVLKQDQPTGRTVSGIVQDVLTRGNHPRGIKVRLSDGRVGRVQSMATAGAISSSTSNAPTESPSVSFGSARNGLVRDARLDMPPPSTAVGLDAYIKPAKTKRKGGKSAGASSSTTNDAIEQGPSSGDVVAEEDSACPVCGNFRGDATAVAHHVASHFDD